eukprot:gene19699-26391_t
MFVTRYENKDYMFDELVCVVQVPDARVLEEVMCAFAKATRKDAIVYFAPCIVPLVLADVVGLRFHHAINSISVDPRTIFAAAYELHDDGVDDLLEYVAKIAEANVISRDHETQEYFDQQWELLLSSQCNGVY